MKIHDNNKTNENTSDPLVASIDRMLGEVPSFCSECCIYKVSEPLRSVNPQAYTPTLISIGPIHFCKDDHLMANKHKPMYLQSFLDLTKLKIDVIVERVKTWDERARNCYADPIVKTWDERARNCYADPIAMSRDDFILLVFDGCFLVMYLISCKFPKLETHDMSNLLKFGYEIFSDFLLLENQLPFFLFQGLYDLCASSHPLLQQTSFIKLARAFFFDDITEEEYVAIDIGKVNHFVDFLRMHYSYTPPKDLDDNHHSFWPPTATELHQCDVSFRTKKGKTKYAMDIVFMDRNGYLELPPIIIYDDFEKNLRNLIAYEQCHTSDVNNEVTNFTVFMQYLLQTKKDVRLLIEDGVIENLGNINEVTQLFNNLGKYVTLGCNFYNHECNKMKKYCKHRRHLWMTMLRRNYFHTPWACAFSIAAILLLALTLLQTVMSVIGRYK